MAVAGTRSYIDKDVGVAALRACMSDLVSALRTVREPTATAVGTWSIRDVAVHLGDSFQVHHGIMRGDPVSVERVEQIGEVNQRLIDENPEHDMNRLADRFETTALPYLEELERRDDEIVTWAGQEVPVSAVIAADIGECIVHGYDISQAEGRPFPIDPHHAALTGKGVSPMTRHYVDEDATRDMHAVFRLQLRGQWGLDFIFDHGTLEIEEPNGLTPDVRISADPVAFLLTGYGRIPIWKPVVTGQIVAFGRKPWLALKFQQLLKNP